MADKLQWFKFTPADWMMGKIKRCPEITQLRFINLCCLYWNKEGNLSIEDTVIEVDQEHYDVLLSKKIIKENESNIQIHFLDEQLNEIQIIRENASKAGKASAEKRKTKLNGRSTGVQHNPTEKSREDEEKSKNKINIPLWEDFLFYAKEKKPSVDQSALKMKYESWKENGWKTGGDKPRKIKNWKTTLLNTLPYMKSETSKSLTARYGY